MVRKKIAVLFGGRAPEHEISIITGIQVLHALNKDKYIPIPVYVSKSGRWILGDRSFFRVETFRDLQKAEAVGKPVFIFPDPTEKGITRKPDKFSIFRSVLEKEIDAVFPAFHGRYGEDGAIQGLLELANIPYVGCDVQASAIGMDKMVSKLIAESLGIPVLSANWSTRFAFQKKRKSEIKRLMLGLKFPVFVKPARLGSSIGIKRVIGTKKLAEALDVAFFYDSKVMVEQGLEDGKEINVSIIGNGPYEISACEQPISSGNTLSFKDKYLSQKGQSKGMASLKRIVPARIQSKTKEKIKEFTARFFQEIGGSGIARADYLVSNDERHIYFNEINTMPGSVAFYLWKAKGLSFGKLVNKLIDMALDRYSEKTNLVTTFKSSVLESLNGAKFSKA